MAVSNKANASSVFDLKSAALSVLALLLKTADLNLLRDDLARRLGDGAGGFDDEPLCLDLVALREADAALDVEALLALLRGHGLRPIAVRGGSPAQMAAARAAGLFEAPEGPAPRPVTAPAQPEAMAVADVAADLPADIPAAEPADPAPPPARVPSLIIDKPLRSGQRVYARGGDLIVLAVVSFGAEVIADGSIHVYAPLRGRAVAGASGDASARIFAASMAPQLVSIAGTWRNLETELPQTIANQPAQIRLDGDKLLFEPLKF